MTHDFHRIRRLPPYVFEQVNRLKANLRAQGVEFLDGPNTVEEGPLAGFNWIYLNTPWGQSLEIASFSSLGYEKTSSRRLWRAKS